MSIRHLVAVAAYFFLFSAVANYAHSNKCRTNNSLSVQESSPCYANYNDPTYHLMQVGK